MAFLDSKKSKNDKNEAEMGLIWEKAKKAGFCDPKNGHFWRFYWYTTPLGAPKTSFFRFKLRFLQFLTQNESFLGPKWVPKRPFFGFSGKNSIFWQKLTFFGKKWVPGGSKPPPGGILDPKMVKIPIQEHQNGAPGPKTLGGGPGTVHFSGVS